jgi:hypothetical protein
MYRANNDVVTYKGAMEKYRIFIYIYRLLEMHVNKYISNYTEGHKSNYFYLCIGLIMMSSSITERWRNIVYLYTYIKIV